jgi:hypothetical protein
MSLRQKPIIVDWHQKLAKGEAFEKVMIDFFRAKGHEAFKCEDRKYDLRVNLHVPYFGFIPITAECKNDIEAERTGNLAIQTMDGNKPSGVHPKGPNPDLWVHGIGSEVWIIKTKIVQELVERFGRTPIKMGDSGFARGVLLPVEQAKKTVGGYWVTP